MVIWIEVNLFAFQMPDKLNEPGIWMICILKVCYSVVSVIQMCNIQIPTIHIFWLSAQQIELNFWCLTGFETVAFSDLIHSSSIRLD